MTEKKQAGAEAQTEDGETSDPLEIHIRSLIQNLAETEDALKKTTREHERFLRKTYIDIIRVCDSFERLFTLLDSRRDSLSEDTRHYINNFRTIYRRVQKVLKDRQVLPIQTESPYFDPHWQQAIEVVEDPDHEDGFVLEELSKGYVWKGQVLREANVKIVKNP
jgi:molecular chaperone GrpE